MDAILYWFGLGHAALYVVAGSAYAAAWLLHRTVHYLGLWQNVYRGLRTYHESKRRKNP